MTLLVHVYSSILNALVDQTNFLRDRASTQHTLRVVGQFLGASSKEGSPLQKMEVQSLLHMVLEWVERVPINTFSSQGIWTTEHL